MKKTLDIHQPSAKKEQWKKVGRYVFFIFFVLILAALIFWARQMTAVLIKR